MAVLLGKSEIISEMDSQVVVSGDISEYVVTNGSLLLSGSAFENNPAPVRFMFLISPGFNIEPLWLNFPVVYYPGAGIRAGLRLGLNL